MRRMNRWAIVAAMVAGCWASRTAQAQTAVLDNDSYFRTFYVYKTPQVLSADGQLTVAIDPVQKGEKPVADYLSPLPPEDWAKPDFDDSGWDRQHGPVEVAPGRATGRSPAALHTATRSAMICVRGKFLVDDPAKAAGLKLSLEYVGGLVVFVNGQELKRASLAVDAKLAPDTLAEKYPDDLYVEPEGMFLQNISKNVPGFEKRYRKLADVEIPAKLLRKGVNVVAIQMHRSAVNAGAVAAKRVAEGGMYTVPGIWAYTGLRSIKLSADAAVAANTGRPKDVQVWTCQPSETVTAYDYGDTAEPAKLVSIAAARNGMFSGRLIVSSAQAIKGLKVTVGELTGDAGKIPAAAVKVRRAEPAVSDKSWAPAFRFDGLQETLPAEVSVPKLPPLKDTYLGQAVDRKAIVPGAIAPIWLSVRVPKDAKPGKYAGQLTVAAEGLPQMSVPVLLNVSAWALADAKEQRIRNLGFLSAEQLGMHYNVPLWSDKHFALIGKSLALMSEINSRQVTVEMVMDWHGPGGNTQSVVRWIKKPDGSFDHDFTVFDKFLGAIAESIGKPLPLRLNCWGQLGKDNKSWGVANQVSLLDPATGTVTPMDMPPPGPECTAFWKPVLDTVRKKVEARGWWDVTALGHNSYCYPPAPSTVDMFKAIWPDGVYAYTAHNGTLAGRFPGTTKDVFIPVRYSECVWTEGAMKPRGYKSVTKPRVDLWADTCRTRHRDGSQLTVPRDLGEEVIMRGHDGIGQLGGDLFPLKKAGRVYALSCDRGGLGPPCSTMAYMAPGPDGPIATERFEMLREGIQLAEAILFLQRALDDKKIDGDLAARVDKFLDQRSQAFIERWTSRRAASDAELLALAGEAAAKSGPN
ncbi:MAG: DUF6067 family protein [Phycisphaerae bacterium]|nr:DUF6067 family protein [Phycisphaerae bacterium]